ncbi:MAG: hypothetical protein EON55_22770, partial [Alphaproteobacteria bacterium]
MELAATLAYQVANRYRQRMSQPDAAFAPDDSLTATSHKGLTYPFGGAEPVSGGVMQVAPGIGWVRLQIPG